MSDKLEFWGRPSQGTWRKVAVVQDTVVVEPVPSTREEIDKVLTELANNPKIEFSMPAKPDEFPTASALMRTESKPGDQIEDDVRQRVDRFPNPPQPGYVDGRYGMHRTPGGHTLSVQRCLRALRPVADTFDCLYVTGLSGLAPAGAVAYMLKKQLLILRKVDSTGSTNSHGVPLEGDAQFRPGVRYMILDDFISNGGTLRQLFKHLPTNGSLVGAVLYGHPRTKTEIADKIAKIFHTYPDGEHKSPQRWHLIRRGPKSMLFDFVAQPRDIDD